MRGGVGRERQKLQSHFGNKELRVAKLRCMGPVLKLHG